MSKLAEKIEKYLIKGKGAAVKKIIRKQLEKEKEKLTEDAYIQELICKVAEENIKQANKYIEELQKTRGEKK